MCIISGKVEEVCKTKIFVAPMKNHNKQFTVYSNKVSMEEKSGAMILPFPITNTSDKICEFFNLENYTDLFSSLKIICKPITLSAQSMNKSKCLNVFQVGSYNVSLAHNCEYLNKIDSKVFELDQSTVDFIKSNYKEGFGFVICELDKRKEYHPFGYIHDTLPSGELFVPTMHYHNHLTDGESKQSDITSDWDHEIFVANTVLTKVPSSFKVNKQLMDPNNFIKTKKLPKSLADINTLVMYTIKDYSKNHDLTCYPISN